MISCMIQSFRKSVHANDHALLCSTPSPLQPYDYMHMPGAISPLPKDNAHKGGEYDVNAKPDLTSPQDPLVVPGISIRQLLFLHSALEAAGQHGYCRIKAIHGISGR